MAMPGMGDPRFHKSAILICAHDQNGTMGLIINSVVPGLSFKSMLEQIEVKIDPAFAKRADKLPVLRGGPVESARGFLIHESSYILKDTIRFSEDFAVSGTVDILKQTAAGNGPKQMIFMLGYAGWSAGQLEKELQENSWLIADPTPQLVFDTPPEEKWLAAVQSLGIDPGFLSDTAGHA